MRKVAFLLALTVAIPAPVSIYRRVFTDEAGTPQPATHRIVESANGDAAPDIETLFKPEALFIKDQDFMSAYRDGFTILSADNNCSRFFGGTAAPLEVFSQMMAKFRKGYLIYETGIQMSGDYSNYKNDLNGLYYRLFEKEIVNTQGAFYKEKRFISEPHIPMVGHFAPNTRQARILMLLHELAHLMRGSDGRWLIPDDGFDYSRSRKNTERIEKHCGEYIRKLE
jgi:hypothetical protein